MDKLRKWQYLTLMCRWDRCLIPVYRASAGSRYVPLLKTLLSSICRNECKYCELRRGAKRPRISWEPEELAHVAMNLWRNGRIRGVFLSSSVDRDPDHATYLVVETARILREEGFSGYIHLRLMPGCSRYLIEEAARLADRIGLNLEAPSEDIFDEICPDKGSYKEDILKRLEWCLYAWKNLSRRRGDIGFCRAGVDTQLIVGAVDDTDLDYIETTYLLLRHYGLRRVYFSAFRPIKGTPLEHRPPCPTSRERRLYEASFLIRDYGFSLDELRSLLCGEMLPNMNLKVAYARANPDLYPIDINQASYWELIRVPGIGPRTARKIMKLRSRGSIRRRDLIELLGPRRFRLARRYIAYTDFKYF